MLAGEIPINNIDTTEAAKDILLYLTRKQATPIPKDVTMHDMKQGFKKWKEETSTSPSGRHLGIYKAITAYEKEIKEISNPETEDMTDAETVLYAITHIINLTVQHQIILH